MQAISHLPALTGLFVDLKVVHRCSFLNCLLNRFRASPEKGTVPLRKRDRPLSRRGSQTHSLRKSAGSRGPGNFYAPFGAQNQGKGLAERTLPQAAIRPAPTSRQGIAPGASAFF